METEVSEGTEVILGIGSNCGDSRGSVAEALEWLSTILDGFRASSIYSTPPFGHPGPSYMNAVALGRWKGEIDAGSRSLRMLCKEYELIRGRDEKSRLERRVPVDIDIVSAGGSVLRPADWERDYFLRGYRELSPK